MIKIYETDVFGKLNGQECLVIIKRGHKHFAKYIFWDKIFPEYSFQYKIAGNVLGVLKKYFEQEKEE